VSEAPSPWALARAALVTALLVVHGLAAAPVPHVVTKRDLANPVSAEEVDRWARRLTALGYTIDKDELSQRVMDITAVIGGAHRRLLLPFRPLFKYTGTGQGWGLFANPDNFPSRLEIRARRAGSDWQTVYLRLDPQHTWAVDVLTYRRIRGIYEANGYGKRPNAPYKRFASWIARRLLAVDPSVEEVEVRMLRTHTTLRGERPDPRAEPRHPIVTRNPALGEP
jgi:hypothetical protein